VFYFKNAKKFKNGIEFTSNIDNAKKSLAKVLNHRIEKLSSLLDSNDTQLNVSANINEIPIERDSAINAASDANSCPSSFMLHNSNIFMVGSEHTCETYEKKIPNSTQLSKRKRELQSKEKRFTCDQCQMKFSLKSNLLKHKRIHAEVKPFSCDFCQMKFSQSSQLTYHTRTHTGEKPYHCDICQKNFTRSYHLTIHKRSHTGEKPYSCDLCPKKFAQSNNLIVHKRIHTGEKPYHCDICQKKFAKSENLSRHKRSHKSFSC
jgi:uncharacterized Zn-finger protein